MKHMNSCENKFNTIKFNAHYDVRNKSALILLNFLLNSLIVENSIMIQQAKKINIPLFLTLRRFFADDHRGHFRKIDLAQ